MDNLTEVITSMHCHPTQCNLFLYSNSRGETILSDLRVAAKSSSCRSDSGMRGSPLVFQDQVTSIDPELIECVSPISSVKFTRKRAFHGNEP